MPVEVIGGASRRESGYTPRQQRLHPLVLHPGMEGYEATRHTAGGAVLEIACRTHAGCLWTLALPGGKREDDPIFVAMFGRHLERTRVPDRPVGGHERSRRR